MSISMFDLFKIGIGPSSSHTVGPMRACFEFIQLLQQAQLVEKVSRVQVDLYGSLGATGKGHGSDVACLLGLIGEEPEKTNPDDTQRMVEQIKSQGRLLLAGTHDIAFDVTTDLIMHRKESLPYHPNGMKVTAYDPAGTELEARIYYSVGGGFILRDDETGQKIVKDDTSLPHPFSTGNELLAQCEKHGMSISEIMLENEQVWCSKEEVLAGIDDIWQVMQDCVTRGCERDGILPGGLKVKRRAKDLYEQLMKERSQPMITHALHEMDWVNLYALAVNEENAAGGRVVTAPTNGAAGIMPAVLHYYANLTRNPTPAGIHQFFLAAAAIGIIIKENASISGAEVGCQGEVGSACAMAAAGLTEALGGTAAQVENAAEIGIEHNLGLTCDPIGGLVQVPCIERNAMAAVKAINASRMARRGNGEHFVSLDHAVKTMKDTGEDMKDKYKETARGGLAIHVIEVPVSYVEC